MPGLNTGRSGTGQASLYGRVTGRVYFIATPDHVKIGFTGADPRRRLRELQVGNAHRLELVGSIPGCMDMEADLHARLERSRASGEWFRRTPDVESVIAFELAHG